MDGEGAATRPGRSESYQDGEIRQKVGKLEGEGERLKKPWQNQNRAGGRAGPAAKSDIFWTTRTRLSAQDGEISAGRSNQLHVGCGRQWQRLDAAFPELHDTTETWRRRGTARTRPRASASRSVRPIRGDGDQSRQRQRAERDGVHKTDKRVAERLIRRSGRRLSYHQIPSWIPFEIELRDE